MLCNEVQEHLSAYLDHELTAELSAAVRVHLDACPDCRTLADNLRTMADMLGRLPVYSAPAHLAADVQREIERRMVLESPAVAEGQPSERTLPIQRASQWPRVAAVAAAVVVAMGIGMLAYLQSTSTPPAAGLAEKTPKQELPDVAAAPATGARPASGPGAVVVSAEEARKSLEAGGRKAPGWAGLAFNDETDRSLKGYFDLQTAVGSGSGRSTPEEGKDVLAQSGPLTVAGRIGGGTLKLGTAYDLRNGEVFADNGALAGNWKELSDVSGSAVGLSPSPPAWHFGNGGTLTLFAQSLANTGGLTKAGVGNLALSYDRLTRREDLDQVGEGAQSLAFGGINGTLAKVDAGTVAMPDPKGRLGAAGAGGLALAPQAPPATSVPMSASVPAVSNRGPPLTADVAHASGLVTGPRQAVEGKDSTLNVSAGGGTAGSVAAKLGSPAGGTEQSKPVAIAKAAPPSAPTLVVPMVSSVNVYPAPEGETLSKDYAVTAGGKAVPVYTARVAPADPARRWKAMDDVAHSAEYFDMAAFASFDMQGPVEITVTCPDEIKSAKILPSSLKISPAIHGKNLKFTLAEPRPVTVEVNGRWVSALHLFANPLEADPPRVDDPNVIYFGPGVHETKGVKVGDGKTVYVAGGAVVRGTGDRNDPVFVLEGKHIRFRGRGIVDGSLCPTHTRNLLMVRGSDITVEGVIFRDSSTWNIPIRQSDRVTVRNVKILGYRANSDGIDICNSRDVTVDGCFIRTLDDLVVVKSDKGQGEVRRIQVEDCVLWNEVAHALSIGAELRENVDDVRFSNCDVIHDKGREWTLRVYHCDSARVTGVRFEDVRIEESPRLMSVWIGKAVWTRDAERGHVDGVTFNKIRAAANPLRVELVGFDPAHAVEHVTFEDVVINDRPLTAADVKSNAFVTGVTVRP
jgi:anti-sigma factor RsiW